MSRSDSQRILDILERADRISKIVDEGYEKFCQEDTGSRMTRIGKSELVYGQVLSFDEILREIADVTQDQIKEIARQILPESPTLAVVGPFRSTSKFERLIK